MCGGSRPCPLLPWETAGDLGGRGIPLRASPLRQGRPAWAPTRNLFQPPFLPLGLPCHPWGSPGAQVGMDTPAVLSLQGWGCWAGRDGAREGGKAAFSGETGKAGGTPQLSALFLKTIHHKDRGSGFLGSYIPESPLRTMLLTPHNHEPGGTLQPD